MKRSIELIMIGVILLLITSGGYGDVDVPEDLTIGGGIKSLNQIESLFFSTTDSDQQARLVKIIDKHTSEKKFDLLVKIISFDVKGDKPGNFVSPVAMSLALEILNKTKNPQYEEHYFNIIKRYVDLKTRILAAKGLGMIGSKNIVPKLINLIQHDLRHPDFREEDEKIYGDDQIVEAIVTSLGEIGDPRCFPALLDIVIKQHEHRSETVQAAWTAMNQLQW